MAERTPDEAGAEAAAGSREAPTPGPAPSPAGGADRDADAGAGRSGQTTTFRPIEPNELYGPHLWQVRWVRDLVLVGLVVFAIWFGYYLRGIFTPVLIGLFLAYLFHPLISWAERRRIPRPASISMLLVLLLGAAAGLGLWLGPKLIDQTIDLANNLATYVRQFSRSVQAELGLDLEWLSARIERFVRDFQADPGVAIVNGIRVLFAGAGETASWIENAVGAATYVAVTLLLIPVYFFFFAWQFRSLIHGVGQYIPQSHRAESLRILGRMDTAVASFFRSRLLISLIMGVLLWLGWWLCDVPYPFVLGMAGGLLNLIPYVGVVVWPLAILIHWLEAAGPEGMGFDLWLVVIWPSVVYAIVQGLEGWVLTPWIQGKQLEMSAVTVLLVVFIGGAVGGLYGLILCLPIAACVKILLHEVVLPHARRWAAGH